MCNVDIVIYSVYSLPFQPPYGSSTIAEEIRKTKSVILGKKKDRDGSASVKSRPQQLMARNEVCQCHSCRHLAPISVSYNSCYSLGLDASPSQGNLSMVSW